MKALDVFTQSIRAQPESPLPPRSINWDNVGGYKTDFDASMGTLTTCTMNVNGLTEPKLDMILQLMQKEAIGVCILTDTKLQKSQMDYYGKKARAVLGGGTRVHCSMLRKAGRNKQCAIHRVGGIMFIVAPVWGPSLVTCQDDFSECGALSSITLQSTKIGRAHV